MSKQRTRSVLRGSDAVVKDAPFTIHVEQSNLRANNKCAVKSNNREARNGCIRNQKRCRVLINPSDQRIPDQCPVDILTSNKTDLANSMMNQTKTRQQCPSAEKAEQTSLAENVRLFHTPDVAVIDMDDQDSSQGTGTSPDIMEDSTCVPCIFKSYSNSNYEQKSEKYLKSVKYRRKHLDKVNKYASRNLLRNRIKLASNCVEELREKKDLLTPEVIIQAKLSCQHYKRGTKHNEEQRECDSFQHFDLHKEVTTFDAENDQNEECGIFIKSDFCDPLADTPNDSRPVDDSENSISISINQNETTKDFFSENEAKLTDQENEKLLKAPKVYLRRISAELKAKYGLYKRDSSDERADVERKKMFNNSTDIQGVLNDVKNINDLSSLTEDDVEMINTGKDKYSLIERKNDDSGLKCIIQKKRTRPLSKVKELKKTKSKSRIRDKKERKPISCRISKRSIVNLKTKSTISKRSDLVCDTSNVIQKPVDIQSESDHNNVEGKINCLNESKLRSHDTVSQKTDLQTLTEETSDSTAVSEDTDTTEVLIAKGAFKMRIKYSDKTKKKKKKLQNKDTHKFKDHKEKIMDEHVITKTANEKTKTKKRSLEDDGFMNHTSEKTKKHHRLKEKECKGKRTEKGKTDISSKTNCSKTIKSDKLISKLKNSADHTSEKISETFRKRAEEKDPIHDKMSDSMKEHLDQVQVTRFEEKDIIVKHLSKPSTGSVSPKRIALLKKQLEIKRRQSTAVLDLNKCLSEQCDLESHDVGPGGDASSIVCAGVNINDNVTVLYLENEKKSLDMADNQKDHNSQKLNISIDNQTSDGFETVVTKDAHVLDINGKVNQALGAGFIVEQNDCDNLSDLSTDRNISTTDSRLSESALICSQPSTEQCKIQAQDDLKQSNTLSAIAINQKSAINSFHSVDCSKGNNSLSVIGNKYQQPEIEHCKEEMTLKSNQGVPCTKNLCRKGEKMNAVTEKTGKGVMNLKDIVVDFEQARSYGLIISDDSGDECIDDLELESDFYDFSLDKCISLLESNTHDVRMNSRKKCYNPLKNDVSLRDAVCLSPKFDSLKNDKIVQDISIKNHTSYTRSFDETDSVSGHTNLVVHGSDRKTGTGTCGFSPDYVSTNILESSVYDAAKDLQHEMETDPFVETPLAMSGENESSVLALPVNYPLAQLFKEKMEAEENQKKLIQSQLIDTITCDNQSEMLQCKACNKRFRTDTMLESHQASSCVSKIEGSRDIEASGMDTTNLKLQMHDGTEREIDKEIDALYKMNLSTSSPDVKQRLGDIEVEIQSDSEPIVSEEKHVSSYAVIKEDISSDTRRVKKKLKKNEKNDRRERKGSGERSKNVTKDEMDDKENFIEENGVDKSDAEVTECSLPKEVMSENHYFSHKLSCMASPQSQSSGLAALQNESSRGQIEYNTSSLNQESTEGSSMVPFTNYGSHQSESDSLSDASHASRSDLKIVLTKVKMCNLIMNGTTLKFCGSVNKPLWKVKDTKKKKRKYNSISVAKIIEEDESKLERLENEDVQTEIELNAELKSDMLDNTKPDIQKNETCKTPVKDKWKNLGLEIQNAHKKTLKKSNPKNSVKLKENSEEPYTSANSNITDFEKQLLIIDHSKLKGKEKPKKKSKVQSKTREKSEHISRIEETDKSLVKLIKEPQEHFMRSKIAQKIYQRDKAQVHDDGLPDFSKYGGQLDTLPPLVVDSSAVEINNNKCKSKESEPSNDLILDTEKTPNMLQKELEEIKETMQNVPTEKLKHSDNMDDFRQNAQKRTYSSIDCEPFFSQYKLPKFEFSTTRYTGSASPSAFYSSDNMSPNELDNSSDNPNSSQFVSENSEISSIEDIDSFTLTDLDTQDCNVVGNSTPSSTTNLNVYGGGTVSRSINCSSFNINQDPWRSFNDSHKQWTAQNNSFHWQNSTGQRGALSSTPFVGNKSKPSENFSDIFELSGISSIHEKAETPPKRQRIKRYVITNEDKQDKFPEGDRRVVVCRDRGLSSTERKVEDTSTEKQSQETSKRKSWRKIQTKSATSDNTISVRNEKATPVSEAESSAGKYQIHHLVSDHYNKEKEFPVNERERVFSHNREVSTLPNRRNLISTQDGGEKVSAVNKDEEVTFLSNMEGGATRFHTEKPCKDEEQEIEIVQTDDCETIQESGNNSVESEPENDKNVESDIHTDTLNKKIEEESDMVDQIDNNTLQDQDSLHSKENNNVDDDVVERELHEVTLQEADGVRNNAENENDTEKESRNLTGTESDSESNNGNNTDKETDAMSEECDEKDVDVDGMDESKTAKKASQFELKEITDDVLYLSDPDMDMFLEDECEFDEDRNSSREQSPIRESNTNRESHSDHLGSVERRSSDRDSLKSEEAMEKDRTKSEGVRKLRWMPKGYCFNFFNNRRCLKTPCSYQHSLPSPNIILQNFNEHLDRNEDETCLDILKSHANVYGSIPNLHLETLYRRLCSNVESFWLLKIMNHKGMLDQIIVDNYIRNFAYIEYTDYLYEVFEMAKGNNIQLQEDVVLKLLDVFSSQESLLEKLIEIMIYSTEDENFLVPGEYVTVAVNGVLKMPKLSGQLLPWLLNTKQLLQLHSDLVERLCDELEKNGVKKDITTEIKNVLKQLKKEAGINEYIMEEMPWTEDDERLWKDNVKSVKYTQDFQHLAELYDEKRSRNIMFTKEDCGLYVDVIGNDRKHVDKALKVFLENVTCRSPSLRDSAVVFRDPLAAIVYGVFELCYNDHLLPMCAGVLATMRDHDISPPCNQFSLRAVKIYISTGQSGLAVDIIKGVNFEMMEWLMQEEFLRCFHDLAGQLGQQGLFMECVTVVQLAFKLVYTCAPNKQDRENLIDLPQICNCLIDVFLNRNFLDQAVTVYGFIQRYGQNFQCNVQLEQKLMIQLYETDCKHIAFNIYEKLKRWKLYKQQEYNTPRKIFISCRNLMNLSVELVMIVEDYLMGLYNLFCTNVLANQHPSHRDLHLKIAVLHITNQTNLLKEAKTILETKLNPPLHSSIEYGHVIISPDSLQNYLTQLDVKGRCQGLKFDAKPGPRNFQHNRKPRR